jgi:hypothetical protein
MTDFKFFRIFLPQTVFIGGWSTKFKKFRIFWASNGKKMVKFVFK